MKIKFTFINSFWLFLLLCLCNNLTLLAQTYTPPPVQWQATYGGGGNEEANSIKQTADGGFIIAGYSTSQNGDVSGHHGTSLHADFWILKLDNSGKISWQKSLGGTDNDIARSVATTSDGGYIVAGDTYSNDYDVHGNHGSQDAWIVKLNSSGDTLWERCYGGTLNETANSIIQTTDGGYLVAGYTNSADDDVSKSGVGEDIWILKLAANGDISWSKTYGGNNDDEAYSIVANGSSYLVAGMSKSSNISGHHGNAGSSDDWVFEIDNTGTQLWSKLLGGSGDDEAHAINATADGGVIIGGFSNSSDGDISGNHGNNDYWIVKLNAAHNIDWQQSFGGSYDDYAYDVEQTTDDGFIISGYTMSNDGNVTDFHGDPNDDFGDYWLIKTDKDGSLQWEKTYGGSSTDRAFTATETSDMGYIVAGYSESQDGDVGASAKNQNYYIIKIQSDPILPVEMMYFRGEMIKNSSAKLSWATASEHNSASFDVMKSRDGKNFTKLTTLAAAGNSHTIKEYVAYDPQAFTGKTFYQLKCNDLDGKFTFSKVIVLNNQDMPEVKLSPNPATGGNFRINSPGLLKVYNNSGQLIITRPDYDEYQTIHLPGKGYYFVQLFNKQGQLILSQKLIGL